MAVRSGTTQVAPAARSTSLEMPPVSTARRGYRTPTGTFRPQALAVWHRSTIYSGSPMPHSIFFHGGYAIHGSYETKYLGRPASHGCVRLHPSTAAALFSLVRKYGTSWYEELKLAAGKPFEKAPSEP